MISARSLLELTKSLLNFDGHSSALAGEEYAEKKVMERPMSLPRISLLRCFLYELEIPPLGRISCPWQLLIKFITHRFSVVVDVLRALPLQSRSAESLRCSPLCPVEKGTVNGTRDIFCVTFSHADRVFVPVRLPRKATQI